MGAWSLSSWSRLKPAVQLVLHAAAIGTGGEIFVLDMGEPIKVVDIARTLVRLSGFVPEEEISIEYIGLRPGEKLIEELVSLGEMSEPTEVEKILKVYPAGVPPPNLLKEQVSSLERLAAKGDTAGVGPSSP